MQTAQVIDLNARVRQVEKEILNKGDVAYKKNVIDTGDAVLVAVEAWMRKFVPEFSESPLPSQTRAVAIVSAELLEQSAAVIRKALAKLP